MPGFKISKDGLTLLLGTNMVGDFTLKTIFSYHSENPRVFKKTRKQLMCPSTDDWIKKM